MLGFWRKADKILICISPFLNLFSVVFIHMVNKNVAEKRHLSEREITGFVSLLKDSEQKTLSLLAQQIKNFDERNLRDISELVNKSEDDNLVDNWFYTSRISLKDQIQEWKKASDLERGLFLISRLHDPGVDSEKYTQILDSYAARVAALITPSSDEDEIAAALNQVLFKEEGFIGNQVDYYDLNNNFLHTVIETKSGNPIMLSSIYILVAKRIGVDIKGVGTPGHFVVKYNDKFLDPFFGGREVTKDECIIRAQELSVYWRDEYLDPIEDDFIIARSIRNLIAIYKKNDDLDKAEDITSLLKLV